MFFCNILYFITFLCYHVRMSSELLRYPFGDQPEQGIPVGEWRWHTVSDPNQRLSTVPPPLGEGLAILSAGEMNRRLSILQANEDESIYPLGGAIDGLVRYTEQSFKSVCPELHIRVALPEDHRIILHNVPKGSKLDGFPYGPERRLRTVDFHTYTNPEGFLVTDKIVGGAIVRHTGEFTPYTLMPGVDPQLQGPSVPVQDMWLLDSGEPSLLSDKEVWRTPDGKVSRVALLGMTSMLITGKGSYAIGEIEVETPDDRGNLVDLRLDASVVAGAARVDPQNLLKLAIVSAI
jgi:hypothetical protein